MIAAELDNWVGLAISVVVTIYLIVVLIRPERF